jgi:uncharacterized protein YcbX
MPPVRIALPGGGLIVSSEQPDIDRILSERLGRTVTLDTTRHEHQAQASLMMSGREAATSEEYWPNIDGLEHRDVATDFSLPQGTFFDCALVHVLTTATLKRLRSLHPQGAFDVRRFRPNIVIETDMDEAEFVENGWSGLTLVIGGARLGITGPCPRCVMTTLPQGDLSRDTGILRTAAQYNQAQVGMYASVLQGGTIRHGDRVSLHEA